MRDVLDDLPALTFGELTSLQAELFVARAFVARPEKRALSAMLDAIEAELATRSTGKPN